MALNWAADRGSLASASSSQPRPSRDAPASARTGLEPRQAELDVGSARPARPGQRRAQVVVLALEPIEPAHCPVRSAPAARPRPAAGSTPRAAAAARPLRAAAQAARRVLADRLQHREARLAVVVRWRSRLSSTSDAEARERIEVAVRADRLGRLQRAAARRRPRAARTALSLGLGAGVVAPVDRRRAASAAARAGRARRRSGASSDCSRRRASRSGGSSLIRAAASSIASGRPSSRAADLGDAARVLVREREAGSTARARADEEPTASFAPARSTVVAGRSAAGAAAPGTRARRTAAAARGWSRAPAGRAPPPAARRRPSRRVEHLLEVVEHEQHAGVRALRDHAASGLARLRQPSACGDRRPTSSGSRRRRGRRTPRRREVGASSAATASARRVLPVPPGPVSVTRRASSRGAARDRGDLEPATDERRRRRRQARLFAARPPARRAPDPGAGSRARAPAARPTARSRARRRARRGLPVGVERSCLAAGAVEREHLLHAEPLAVRVLGDQALELGDSAAWRPSASSASMRSSSACRRSSSSRAASACGERLVGEVGERRPAPERERLADRSAASAAWPLASTPRARRAARSGRGRARPARPAAGSPSPCVSIRSAPSACAARGRRPGATCRPSRRLSPQSASISRSRGTTSPASSSKRRQQRHAASAARASGRAVTHDLDGPQNPEFRSAPFLRLKPAPSDLKRTCRCVLRRLDVNRRKGAAHDSHRRRHREPRHRRAHRLPQDLARDRRRRQS